MFKKKSRTIFDRFFGVTERQRLSLDSDWQPSGQWRVALV